MTDQTDSYSQTPYLVAYLATLSLLLIASFFPEARLWGFSGWFVFSLPVRLALFGLGLVPPAAMLFVSARTDTRKAKDSSRNNAIAIIVLMHAAGLLFYALAAETHFLGDGQAQLSALARNHPPIMPQEYGTMLVHTWVSQLHGGPSEEAARFSYKTISVVSGMLFFFASGLFARRLFVRSRDRLLFVLGLCSAGYMLLFFGYVEHYALLCLTLLVFVLTGVLIARERVSGWFILIPLALAIFFHAVGIVLVPAALYLLVTRTGLGTRVLAMGRWPIRALIGFLAVLGIALSVTLYSSSYAFRFAIMPLLADRFTVAEYTLFSLPHLLDYLNLLWLLLPALLLLIVLLVQSGLAPLRRATEYRFLLWLLVATLLGALLLDPRFGMARDWGHVSFPGIIMAVLFYGLLLDPATQVRRRSWVAILGISLGLLSLVPRAVVQHVPALGAELYRSYLERDPRRNQESLYLLTQYYTETDNTEGLAWAERYRMSAFPETDMSVRVERLLELGEITKARRLCKKIIESSPRLPAAWYYMGEIYDRLNKHDSAVAVLEIALGLNPLSPSLLNPLGRSYLYAGDTLSAVRTWGRAIEVDPENYIPLVALGSVYLRQGDEARYLYYTQNAAVKRGAPGRVSLDLAGYHAFKGDYIKADGWFMRAINAGVDSTLAESLLDSYPALRKRIGR